MKEKFYQGQPFVAHCGEKGPALIFSRRVDAGSGDEARSPVRQTATPILPVLRRV
ncbi:hypothetical protein ACMHYO_00385 [Allopusillimonas ginsengisoli]|uniref:hypothetical protein n=1 Tax=Allopusillimonas ginsengisoli TaxID=453575 RepID=UPI0039C1F7D1